MVPHAFDKLVETAATGVYLPSVITGLVTLATIIACTIWLKGSKRFFAMLIGCAAGYAAAATLGELGSFAEVVGQASMVDLPQLRMPSLSLEPSFLAGYAIVAMIAAVDNMGGMFAGFFTPTEAAAAALADSGRPASFDSSVMTSSHALVESNTCSAYALVIFESSASISAMRAFGSAGRSAPSWIKSNIVSST